MEGLITAAEQVKELGPFESEDVEHGPQSKQVKSMFDLSYI